MIPLPHALVGVGVDVGEGVLVWVGVGEGVRVAHEPPLTHAAPKTAARPAGQLVLLPLFSQAKIGELCWQHTIGVGVMVGVGVIVGVGVGVRLAQLGFPPTHSALITASAPVGHDSGSFDIAGATHAGVGPC